MVETSFCSVLHECKSRIKTFFIYNASNAAVASPAAGDDCPVKFSSVSNQTPGFDFQAILMIFSCWTLQDSRSAAAGLDTPNDFKCMQ